MSTVVNSFATTINTWAVKPAINLVGKLGNIAVTVIDSIGNTVGPNVYAAGAVSFGAATLAAMGGYKVAKIVASYIPQLEIAKNDEYANAKWYAKKAIEIAFATAGSTLAYAGINRAFGEVLSTSAKTITVVAGFALASAWKYDAITTAKAYIAQLSTKQQQQQQPAKNDNEI